MVFDFVFYSFGGFLLEVLYSYVTGGAKKDRKCFYLLPLCPVYGVGAVAILALPQVILQNFWLLFFCGAIVATAAEYLVGLFDEKIVGVVFWDYSHLPCNLGGKICLLFSGFWGLLSALLVRVLHPLVAAVTAQIPLFLALPLLVLVVGDGLRSAVLLRRTRSPNCLMWYRHQGLF